VLLAAVEIKPEALRERLMPKELPNLWIPRIIKRVDAIPFLASGKLDMARGCSGWRRGETG
jgi:acyl-[acyl-carrier-protein]-phospholipid O-acyltransferase/long-chain-fatty-acid--[acyl-carrier-protein] ligase